MFEGIAHAGQSGQVADAIDSAHTLGNGFPVQDVAADEAETFLPVQ